MATIVKRASRAWTPFCVTALTCATLAGCSRGPTGQDEMSWARTALGRNAHLEIVATDAQARTFTVRLKDSGELRVLPLDQIVAGPAIEASPGSAPSAAAAVASAESSPAAASDSSATSEPGPAMERAPATESAAAQSVPPPAPTMAGGAGASRAATANADATTAPTPTSDADNDGSVPHADRAADARPGSLLASGPGYSIQASGPKSIPSRGGSAITSRGTPVERLHDPIICQGSRLLHIDNRNLQFDGDAVSAEDGCEIHITNTRISAKGIGVLVRAANVHIENSEIEGDSGAIEASAGAQVYAESSRFKGLTRRLEDSAFHDLGGNVWN
ncbi:MAG TPA: hypothetical protein VMT29_07040 [Steroidobacteraceae bacterium]|nr:hypothetical protein [Steroidobacteraceae bacterium]